MGCSTSIFIAADEEECVTLYSSVVKTKSLTINSTSGHVVVKFQWNLKREQKEILLSLTIMCAMVCVRKNDTNIWNIFPNAFVAQLHRKSEGCF